MSTTFALGSKVLLTDVEDITLYILHAIYVCVCVCV